MQRMLQRICSFPQEALQDTRMKLSATIDEINRQLGCPLTPRDAQTGATVNYQETSVLDLWRMVSGVCGEGEREWGDCLFSSAAPRPPG